jgi:hypothetical protein
MNLYFHDITQQLQRVSRSGVSWSIPVKKTCFTQSDRFETVWEATERAKELSGIDGWNRREP